MEKRVTLSLISHRILGKAPASHCEHSALRERAMAFVQAAVPPVPARRSLVCTCEHAHAKETGPAKFSRRALLAAIAAAGTGAALVQAEQTTTASGLSYAVVKHGTGLQAASGDLVGIRFKGSYNGVVFDNLFDSAEPYFYRAGSGNVLKVCEFCSFLSWNATQLRAKINYTCRGPHTA